MTIANKIHEIAQGIRIKHKSSKTVLHGKIKDTYANKIEELYDDKSGDPTKDKK